MRRRLAAVLGVALLGVAGAVWLTASSEPAEPEPKVALPSTGISHASIVLRQRGRKQAEIAAERVEVSPDGRTTVFSGRPKVVVFEEDAARLTMTGNRIVYDRATQDVKVEGSLRVTTSEGETLNAPSASWDHRKQIMDLTGPVEVTFPLRRVR
ncbi:MAG: LPS export ABC transporter periplasmic protein LptC [Armatimonadota bacterium]